MRSCGLRGLVAQSGASAGYSEEGSRGDDGIKRVYRNEGTEGGGGEDENTSVTAFLCGVIQHTHWRLFHVQGTFAKVTRPSGRRKQYIHV